MKNYENSENYEKNFGGSNYKSATVCIKKCIAIKVWDSRISRVQKRHPHTHRHKHTLKINW